MSDSGFLVETKKGWLGRTYHSKGKINNKIPVYLYKDGDANSKEAICTELSDKPPILCNDYELKVIGFID